MEEQYDFSKAERGKFHRPDAKLNIPVYLESEVQAFIDKIAEARQSDTSTVVNQLLRSDMDIAKVLR
ncbi:MAG: hypothetical protein HN350_09635 [Phycisphaerales bacterium]|jgi:hypothetical protein|nr:hypothetical protein [Phycisphaerales bacterium]